MSQKITTLNVDHFSEDIDINENAACTEQAVSVDQLTMGHQVVPEQTLVRAAIARNEYGDVTFWRNHGLPWSTSPADLPSSTSAEKTVDLIVRGHPKSSAALLVTVPEFEAGWFESPVSISLAYGYNWASQFESAEIADKTAVLEKLTWMKTRAHQNLSYDRFHYSGLHIMKLIESMDDAVASNSWTDFVANVRQLYEQEEMQFDPYVDQTQNQ